MPPQINDINKALNALIEFRKYAISPSHERFIFPFLCGSYFTYRKVDVVRIFTISKAISENPTYLDVGCGYGDFLEKVREYIPTAEGIEKSAEIFYSIGRIKPDYIKIADAYNGIDKKYDIIFVGWMEPGVDYREKIAESAPQCIITTLDQGLSLAAEFDGHGFEKIASWITPSWEDVNIEITNRYYSKITNKLIQKLADLRGAHNLWYIYCKPQLKNKIKGILKRCVIEESRSDYKQYEFETVLDNTGYRYFEKLKNPYMKQKLWDCLF
jgi:SAM-dependent methyltransferase